MRARNRSRRYGIFSTVGKPGNGSVSSVFGQRYGILSASGKLVITEPANREAANRETVNRETANRESMNKKPANRQPAVRCAAGLFVLLLLCLHCFGLRAAAANDAKVADEAGLLTYEEEQKLQEQLSEIAEEYQCDVVVATVDSCEGMDVQSFTDRYYYRNDYGYGPELDGIILLISMQERKFHLATRGSAIDTFTDYGLEVIDNRITPYLRDGRYAEAFGTFADLAEQFLEEDAKGRPYDTTHTYGERSIKSAVYFMYAMGIGLFAAIVTLVVLFQQLKSVRVKNEARDYVRSGSFRVTRANDIFLYRTVSRRKIEREKSSGGGGHGGGSTTHSAPGGGGRAGGRSGSF